MKHISIILDIQQAVLVKHVLDMYVDHYRAVTYENRDPCAEVIANMYAEALVEAMQSQATKEEILYALRAEMPKLPF